ncbi:hypothetical protein [Streptomyces fulvoviolaceus]|uniref:hypothetical protein n=1 Tax=Streptomyces fulvoviolaceus TaxID=285535 RepID=UPI00069415BF|nr:hypothetical protein [Streptomyces fulvoviolaceus]
MRQDAQLAHEDGEVDQQGTEWIATSETNYRTVDQLYDYTIDRVVLHVTQSIYPVALKSSGTPATAPPRTAWSVPVTVAYPRQSASWMWRSTPATATGTNPA